MNKPEISGKSKVYLGRIDGEIIYLSKPSFDCGWYWGFGYIGNRNLHMHLNGVLNDTDTDWFTGFQETFTDICEPLQDDKTLWKFLECIKTLYALKEVASIYHCGGSNQTTPVVDLKNEEAYNRIVFEEMPKLFEAVANLIEPS